MCEGYPDLVFIQDKYVSKIGPDHRTPTPSEEERGPAELETKWEHQFLVQEDQHTTVQILETTDTGYSPTMQQNSYTIEASPEGSQSPPASRVTTRARGSPTGSISSFKSSIFFLFLEQNLLQHLEAGRKSILDVWESDDVSLTVGECTKALAFAFYGKYHQCTDILEQAAVIYSRALRRLKRDLTDPDEAWSTSVIVSTIALILYEVRYQLTNKAPGRLFEACD